MELRTYSSLAAAKKALKRFELNDRLVRFDSELGERGQRIVPVIICDTQVEKRRVEEFGFAAELRPVDYQVGTTVALDPSVPAGSHDEVARIESFFTTKGHRCVKLDRPLGGTVYWRLSGLVIA